MSLLHFIMILFNIVILWFCATLIIAFFDSSKENTGLIEYSTWCYWTLIAFFISSIVLGIVMLARGNY